MKLHSVPQRKHRLLNVKKSVKRCVEHCETLWNYIKNENTMFKNKTLLITGGTGSFGNAVLNRFLDSDIKEIRIFSREEKAAIGLNHSLDLSIFVW